MIRHWEQRIERARYEVDRAVRQYQACEPENRLVARTLERCWEEALEGVQQLEAEFDRFTRTQPRLLDEIDRERIRRLAGEALALWRASTTTPADRRQVIRWLVDRVVLTADPGEDRVAVQVEWAGVAVREQTIHRDVQGYKNQQSWPRLLARQATLHGRGEMPKAIAAILDRDGFRPSRRASRFTAGMVRRLPAVLSPDERWLHDLARLLALSPHTLHGWRKKGWIQARQVGGRGGPWTEAPPGPSPCPRPRRGPPHGTGPLGGAFLNTTASGRGSLYGTRKVSAPSIAECACRAR